MDYRNFFQIKSHICDKGVGAPLLCYSGFCYLEGACRRKTGWQADAKPVGSRYDSYDGAVFFKWAKPGLFLFFSFFSQCKVKYSTNF